jgi:transcriptional regulator with XRE-family HTH domain
MIGVNRTQFSRYLSGKSMPRPEVLYQLSVQLGLPLEWFFSSDVTSTSETAVLQFGNAMAELVRGRNFQIMDDVVQDGLYLLWKGMFNSASGAEALMCSVNSYAGVKKIKLSVRRILAEDGVIDGLPIEHHFINGVMFKSSEGVLSLFSESRFNIMWAGYMQKAYLKQSRGLDENLIGVLTNYRPAGRNAVSLVPLVLEKISDKVGGVLSAARRSTRYYAEDIPPHIQTYFKIVDVPEYRF